jgi:hypothetical protein
MGEPRDHKFREQWWRRIEADPNPDITDTLLAAAYAISTQARTDGTRALISIIRLAQILRKNERTARRRVQKLRDLEYLELVERGGHRGDGTVAANVYSLALPPTGEPESDTEMSPWADSQPDTYVPLDSLLNRTPRCPLETSLNRTKRKLNRTKRKLNRTNRRLNRTLRCPPPLLIPLYIPHPIP